MSESATADPHEDLRRMDAALNLGSRSLGLTAPNPAVGAILVKDRAVVGSGATAPGGRPHAERIALSEAGEAARSATWTERVSLSRSNGARRPFFLTTCSSRSCTRSKVVNRPPQSGQMRRRRIDEESSVGRESFTCVSRPPQ